MKPNQTNIVFICSPFAGAGQWNKDFAESACRYAVDLGYTPFAPHLFFTQFLDDGDEAQRAQGIKLGMRFLPFCEEVWVCGSVISKGMKEELERARALRIPIKYKSAELILEWDAANADDGYETGDGPGK